ncbi:MAG: T9SS type A sorting domain-containing protein [Candidatus Kapabacteria bacterium]|nr:T9SS type A sorting domain-containing protein [Candidatus Kapabacteria bacterium]
MSEWIDVSPKSLNLKETIYDVSFLDSDTAYAVGWSSARSIILKTTNAGNDWQLKEFTGYYFFSVEATFNQILIVGYSSRCMCGVLFFSIDHGSSWNFYEFDGEKNPLTFGAMKVRKNFNNIFFITGFNGFVVYFDDDEEKWFYSNTNNTTDIFRDIKFIDEFNCFSLAGKNSNVSDKIYYSSNAGKDWEVYTDFSEEQILISGFHFFTPYDGYIFGISQGQEAILKTSDKGKSWVRIYQGDIGNMLSDGLFLDDKLGFAAKRNGVILQTNDGGINWIPLQSPTFKDLKGFRVHKQNEEPIAYAFGNDGTILKFSKTTDVKQINSNLIIYPNPVNNYIKIELNDQVSFNKAEIFNLLGEKVKIISELSEKKIINVENLPKGLYLLVLYGTYDSITIFKFQKN